MIGGASVRVAPSPRGPEQPAPRRAQLCAEPGPRPHTRCGREAGHPGWHTSKRGRIGWDVDGDVEALDDVPDDDESEGYFDELLDELSFDERVALAAAHGVLRGHSASADGSTCTLDLDCTGPGWSAFCRAVRAAARGRR